MGMLQRPELILSRCLQSKQDRKVETEITKHLIRSWWNQGPTGVGSAISETQRPYLFRGTSKSPIKSQERWEAKTLQRILGTSIPAKSKLKTDLRCFPWCLRRLGADSIADVSLLLMPILTYSTFMEDIGLSLMRPKRAKQLNIQLKKKKKQMPYLYYILL